jgi:hypothetical protein
MINPFLVRLIAACITIIGVIIVYFIIDYFARKKAAIEIAKMKLAQEAQKAHAHHKKEAEKTAPKKNR